MAPAVLRDLAWESEGSGGFWEISECYGGLGWWAGADEWGR